MDLSGLTGLLEGIGETDDIPAIIDAFAKILAEIINIVKNFFGSISGETEETTNA